MICLITSCHDSTIFITELIVNLGFVGIFNKLCSSALYSGLVVDDAVLILNQNYFHESFLWCTTQIMLHMMIFSCGSNSGNGSVGWWVGKSDC